MFRLYLVGNRRQGDGSPPATGSLQGRAGLEPVAQQTQTARNTQRECPVPNQRIGSEIGYGVFREIDAKGRIVMYCMKLEDGPVRYSLREVVGPAEDYQLEPINVGQREELAKELERPVSFGTGFTSGSSRSIIWLRQEKATTTWTSSGRYAGLSSKARPKVRSISITGTIPGIGNRWRNSGGIFERTGCRSCFPF